MDLRRIATWLLSILALTGCDRWVTKPSLDNTIEVVVSTRDGSPVSGANLTLFTGQRAMGYATTGTDGRFTFTRVPQGSYGVVATPPVGFELRESLVRSAPTNIVQN